MADQERVGIVGGSLTVRGEAGNLTSAGPTAGLSMFSLTPAWRAGAGMTDVLERLASLGCAGPVEVIGHQSWRGFPELGDAAAAAFLADVDRLGFAPVVLGVYTDVDRRAGSPLTHAESLTELRAQLVVATRLGFPMVRTAAGMDPDLAADAARAAGDLGLVLTFEVQGSNTPDSPAVEAVLALRDRLGPVVGLTLDTSLRTPGLPEALAVAMRRHGAGDDEVRAVHDAWSADGPLPQRVSEMVAALQGSPRSDELLDVVIPVFWRVGRQDPATWRPLLPAVTHAHGKFWDADHSTYLPSQAAWVRELVAAGFTGAVVTEWGGHELLDTADADHWQVTADHVVALRGAVADAVRDARQGGQP